MQMRQKKYIQQDLFNPIVHVKKPEQLWNLVFNNREVLVRNQPYGVCAGKKKQLLPQSKGFSHLYKIVPSK